jgi:FkbM family methyltransferase
MSLAAIKRASLALGLYRPARLLYRRLRKSERDAYKIDKRLYKEIIPESGALCFDVGANIGRISEVLLELGHKVIAFEPQERCVREIKARCGPFKQRLRIEKCVLGDAPGVADMFVRESSSQSSMDSAWEGKPLETIKVKVSTIDIAIQEFGLPQYCKIDVEGWERHVLAGLSQRIPLISFEYHQEEGMMQNAFACLDHLRSICEIRVNITPREESRLALEEWASAESFRDSFQSRFQDKDEFFYGDIYVRML